MSWGAEGAGAASSGASGLEGAGSGMSTSGLYSNAIDITGKGEPAAGGFSIQPTGYSYQTQPGLFEGVKGGEVSESGVATQGYDGGFGSSTVGSAIDKFQKGKDSSLGKAYDNFGNNPETYGYAAGKLGMMASLGGGGAKAAPINTMVTYQQPENAYLKRRGY